MNLFELYKMLEENQEKKNNFLATVVEGSERGSRLLFSEGRFQAEYGNAVLTPEEQALLTETGQSQLMEVGQQKIFVERLRRPAHLVICGGGHVSQQVLLLAKNVGFFVTVIEDRPFFADKARRAGADLVLCEDFKEALKTIPGSEDTYFLVVTRGHRHDRICLESILKKPRCYVGMMASRGRAALLKSQMEEEGTAARQALEEIHTPVGLSIHAETPEEIAVSIVAELIMEKNTLQKTSGYDQELLEYLTGSREPETRKALATIIARRGSAPREIGTKMLILEDGRAVGTIGGGCTESEVQHLCLHMLRENLDSRIVTVDMTAAQAEEEGLVCGGTIQVFLEVL